jgi:SAGA-associated factor 29
VAAKVSKTNENGSWILGNVLEFDSNTHFYEIQDEDDVSRVMSLYFLDVKRLDDSASYLRRGDEVLAVFPETTSFYRAVVAKNPKFTSGSSPSDVIVRFEDDEDATGKAPARRIPARFVLRRSDVERGGEGEDGREVDGDEDAN